MQIFYIGATMVCVEGWQGYLPEPKAPSNYKDPIKISNYIETAREKQAAEAMIQPLAGRLNRACLLNNEGDPLWGTSTDDVDAGLGLIQAIHKLADGEDRVIIGFDAPLALKLGLVNALDRVRADEERTSLDSSESWVLRQDQTMVIDPLRAVFGGSPNERAFALKRLGMEEYVPQLCTAEGSAHVAFVVAQLLGY